MPYYYKTILCYIKVILISSIKTTFLATEMLKGAIIVCDKLVSV